MEALVVLLLLFLAVVLFVFPLWAFIKIRAHAEEFDAVREELARLRNEAEQLRVRLAQAIADGATTANPAAAQAAPETKLTPASTPAEVARPAATSFTPATTTPLEAPAPAAPAVPPQPFASAELPPPLPSMAATPAAMAAAPVPPVAPVTPATPTPVRAPIAPPTYTPPTRKAPAFNWEQFMGVKLFAWLGGFALFLGAVFFVKLSIEQGWIPPEVRVALGFLLGGSLIVGGVVLSRKRYAVTAQTLCATGIVTLYAITFACRSIYHFEFFGVLPTFGLMVLITTTAFFLAIRMDARVVAILGILGGFLTPLLLSTGRDNPAGLFGYIALLNAGLIAVALHRRWHFLVPLGALCTGIMEVGWAMKFPHNTHTMTAIVVCLSFDVLFLAAFALAHRRRQADAPLSLPVAGLVMLSFCFAWYMGAETAIGIQPLRWLSFVFLADLCILALVLLDPRTAKLHAVAGMAVFVLLAGWTFSRLNADLLGWALAGYLIYAALHSAFPLVLHRVRPDVPLDGWHQVFAPLSLILVLGPVLNSPHATQAIWPAILLIDLIAIVLAWLTMSAAAVVAVLILTLVAAAQAIFRLPVGDSGNGLLVVIAGFAVLFFAVGLGLARKLRREAPGEEPGAKLIAQLPVFSALLPFVLLIMATGRLSQVAPMPIFGMALLLVVLTLGLARLLGRGALAPAGLVGVLALVYSWFSLHFSPVAATTPLLWFIVFYALFTAFPFVFRRTFADQRLPWLAAALAGPLFFPAVFGVVNRAWPNDVMGLLPALFALPSLVCVLAILRLDPPEHPRRLGRLALFGGMTLLFITLIFPIQFERQWVTIAWALEGVALLWMYNRLPHRGVPLAGFLLLVVAFLRLAANPAVLAYHPKSATPIFNWYLYTYGIVVVCLLVGARLLAPPRERVLGLHAPRWLNALGVALLFLLVNIEIADYFGGDYTRLTFDFSGNFARDMTYTIAWALFAFGLLIVGIWKAEKGARYASLALLGVALLKLFFHDLSQLAQLYRIGALFGVAVVAILASFLYQRFVPADEKKPTAEP